MVWVRNPKRNVQFAWIIFKCHSWEGMCDNAGFIRIYNSNVHWHLQWYGSLWQSYSRRQWREFKKVFFSWYNLFRAISQVWKLMLLSSTVVTYCKLLYWLSVLWGLVALIATQNYNMLTAHPLLTIFSHPLPQLMFFMFNKVLILCTLQFHLIQIVTRTHFQHNWMSLHTLWWSLTLMLLRLHLTLLLPTLMLLLLHLALLLPTLMHASASSPYADPAPTSVGLCQVDEPQSLASLLHNLSDQIVKGAPLDICRNELFSQAVAFYKTKTSCQLSQPLHVRFEGEAGIDAGGLRREFFQLFFNLLLIQEEVYLRVPQRSCGLSTTS